MRRWVSFSNKKILDIGCGGGILSEAMAKLGGKVTGIDLATEAINVAREHARESNLLIDYEITSIENFSEKNSEPVDIITCLEMLEHVPNPESILKSCANLLKPGGYAFFSTINRSLNAYFQAVIGAEYILQLLPKGTHDYQKFIKPSEIAAWIREENLNLLDISGVHYNPIIQRFSLTPNPAVNYLLCCQKPN